MPTKSETGRQKAAIQVQAVYRGHRTRQALMRVRSELLRFLSEIEDSVELSWPTNGPCFPRERKERSYHPMKASSSGPMVPNPPSPSFRDGLVGTVDTMTYCRSTAVQPSTADRQLGREEIPACTVAVCCPTDEEITNIRKQDLQTKLRWAEEAVHNRKQILRRMKKT